MTTMRRMLQRGVVLLALAALLAAACGGDTATNDEAASESTPSTTVEETTSDSVTTDTTPPTTAEIETREVPDFPVPNFLRRDCRPWATKVNPEYPIPGTVTAVAVSKFPFNSGVMIAIEEDPGIVLLVYSGSGDVELAQPFDADAASTGGGDWHPVDEASADYLGYPSDMIPPGYGDEVVVAMQECLASIQNWEPGTEPSWADSAAEAMAWMADASIAVGDANSPAEKIATCTAVLADPEKERAMDALRDIPLERGTTGHIRDTFHLMMHSCKNGDFEGTAQWQTTGTAFKQELSVTLDALGYPPMW